MSKAVAYVRVSSKEQSVEGYSIPAQRSLLREYAEKNGLKVVREYEEVETAKQAGRREFSQMVEYLKKHENVSEILVEKTDRLYRNFRDLVTLDELGRSIHFVKENVVLGPESRSADKLSHNIKVVLAKNYIDNLSEETSKGMLEKARQGLWPSCAPIGYRNNRQTGCIEVDWPQASVIRELFQLYATRRYSTNDLTKIGREKGLQSIRGNRVGKSSILRLLRNPIYTGEFVWNGVRYAGKHEAIIHRDLFERVQEVLADTHHPCPTRHNFAFRGFVKCGHCGCSITGQIAKGKYIYYRCTKNHGPCPQKPIREEELARQLGEPLKRLRLTPERVDWILEAIHESSADERAEREREATQLQAQQGELEERIDRLYEDKLAGVITEEFWKRKYEEYSKRQTQLRGRLENLEKHHANYAEDAERLVKLSQEAYLLYVRQNSEEQRKLADLLYSNCKLVHGRVVPTLAKPFDLLADGAERERRLPEGNRRRSLTDPIWLPK